VTKLLESHFNLKHFHTINKMAPLHLRLLWVMIICVVFVGCVNCARDQKANNTLAKEHREKKAHLVKKYLKRLKKPEGLVRLVDGRGDYEGKLMQVTIHYSAPTILNFYRNTLLIPRIIIRASTPCL